MPVPWLAWRLAHLSAGRPLRIKHHLLGSQSGLWQRWNEDDKPLAPNVDHCACQHSDSILAVVAPEEEQDNSPVELSRGLRGEALSQGQSSVDAHAVSEGKGASACIQTSALDQHFRSLKEERLRFDPQTVGAAQPLPDNGPSKRGQHTPAGIRQAGPKGAQFPPATDWGLVQKAMRKAAGRRPRVERERPQDPELWHLWTLCRDGRMQEVEEQLAALLQQRGPLSIKAFNYLLKGCATGAHLQLGHYVYALMQKSGVPPDVRSLGWMLRLYVRAGQVKQALPWLDAEWLRLPSLVSRETGAALSPAYFLNVLLEECITRCDWAAVGECADRLGVHGMDSKTHLLLLQIGGLERRPESVALMWAAFQEGGRSPTVVERSAYIQALARCDCVTQAVQELRALGRCIQAGSTGGEKEGGVRLAKGQGQSQQDWLQRESDDGSAGLLVSDPQEGSNEDQAGSVDALRAAAEGGLQDGLWWTAPPPRSTDRNTLAHLRVAYNAVIAAAARCKDVSKAEELFAEMRRADLQPDRYTYNALLRAVTNAKPLEDAQRVFRSMTVGGILPDAHTVASMVKACTQAGQYAQAATMLEDAAQAHPRAAPQYTHAFNALLEACAQQGDQSLALRVFQRMRALHVAPDSCTYTALFQAFQRPPLQDAPQDHAEHRQQLLMLEQDMQQSGVQHDPHTYTALVKALGPTSLPSLLNRVADVKRAAQKGEPLLLDTSVFNAIITACAQAAQLPAALSVFADMGPLRVRPDAATYNALLDCCAAVGDVRQGLRLAAQAQREGLLTDAYSLNAVIKLCCFSGRYLDALPLVFHAEASGGCVDCVGYNLLLTAAGRAGDVRTLERIAERMRRRKIAPDGDTCLAVVEAYLQHDQADEAAEALDTLTARMFGHGGAPVPAMLMQAEARQAGKQAEDGEQQRELADIIGDGVETYREGSSRQQQEALLGRGSPQAASAVSQRQLHIASWRAKEITPQEELEFVADFVEEGDNDPTAAEDVVTAAVVREAMLCPSYRARSEFLTRMVGVSGGGFEGPPEKWRARTAMLTEVDWNSWAFRVRKEYDARRASRLRTVRRDKMPRVTADKPCEQAE